MAVALVAATTPSLSLNASEAWPTRPVRVIVPLPAGSAVDAAARLVGDVLSKRWGQPVVVENRPGADGSIGTGAFASTRDDHTLMYGIASALTVNPLVQDKLPYDPTRDLVPISAVTNASFVVAVHNGVPARSLVDLARLARAEPGKLFWSSGPGLTRYVFSAFLKRGGLEMLYVSYKDVASQSIDLGEGRIQVLITALQVTNTPVHSGKAHIIAVTNSRRAPMLPDVPTAAEAGHLEMTMDGLSGFFGWRGMPVDLRDKISADVQAAVRDSEVRARIEASGQSLLGGTPVEFEAAIEAQRARVHEIAQLIDLRSAK
jgi:tripartite-type tricarboxylate transporter receptor subunit TctC